MDDEIHTIEDVQRLMRAGETDWSKYGEVRYETWEELTLLEYKAAAQWAARWNWFERVCRGLILDSRTGEVVARPFDKFFNWGEDGLEPGIQIAEITEKLDGSLGILYRKDGECRISTRGTFHSEQAHWATDYLRAHYDLRGLPDELTLLFEIIYPGNRVVVDYAEREDIVLIGVRNRFTGEDWFYPQIVEVAVEYGFSLPETYQFESIEHMLEAARALGVMREGWVIRSADGIRYKVKGHAYRLAHRIVTQATFGQVLAAVANDTLVEVIKGVPDEFVGPIRAWQAEIEGTVEAITSRVSALVAQLPSGDRKAAALWIKANCPSDAHYVFAMMDGKDLRPLIYRTEFKNRIQVEE